MVSIKIISALIILLSLLSLCSNSRQTDVFTLELETNNNEPEVVLQINEFSLNTNVIIKAGTKFTVEASLAVTKGFEWYLDNATVINRKVLEPLNLNQFNTAMNYVETESNLRNIKRGIYTFEFKALARTELINLRFVIKNIVESVFAKTVKVSVSIN